MGNGEPPSVGGRAKAEGVLLWAGHVGIRTGERDVIPPRVGNYGMDQGQ